MKSNLSVGPPLDLVVYEANRFETDKIVCLDMQNPYYRMLHQSWGQKLRSVFDSLDDPVWDESHTDTPLRTQAGGRSKPLRKITRPEEKLI
jgi:putative proteasome-type protease